MVDGLDDSNSIVAKEKFAKIEQEWQDLSTEYKGLEKLHKEYRLKVEEVNILQKQCVSGVKHQNYRLNGIQSSLSVFKEVPGEHRNKLEKEFLQRKMQLLQIQSYLPRESGPYLKLILGCVNVSISDKESKYQYKDQYEQFKLTVMLLGSIMAMASLCLDYRVVDLCLMFLVVWYYCTLTIRESILRVNGSEISGWWRAHHFITTIAGGILLIWPDGNCFRSFRLQYLWFTIYIGLVSYMQCHYQRGCLYRLRCLGERDNDMDITIDGFQSWMWKGLGFLLPFLTFGYAWQLYHSYTLYVLSLTAEAEWQVFALSILFAILGIGNILATSWTITKKIRDRQIARLKLGFAYTKTKFLKENSPTNVYENGSHEESITPINIKKDI